MLRFTVRSLIALVVIHLVGGSVVRGETNNNDGTDIGEVVVTANRISTRVNEIGSSVTVITAEDIAKRKANSVTELLRGVPGVFINESGGRGTQAEIRLRGTNDVHALLLVDGIKFHSATLGTAQFAHLTPDRIERIEIVMGPQSTLYGSEAIGGVIQIFTKKGTRNESTIAYEGGTYNTSEVRASTMMVSDNQSLSIGGAWSESERFSTFNGNRGAVERDPYRNTSVSATYAGVHGKVDADVALHYVDGEIFRDATGVDNTTRFSHQRQLGGSLKLTRPWGRQWTHSATFTGFQDYLFGRDASDFTIISTNQTADWQSRFDMSEKARFTGGFDYELERGENRFSFSGRNTMRSWYLDGLFHPAEKLHVTLGARSDEHSSYGDRSTWKTTASYQFKPMTRMFGSYGTGFKAPTFNQLLFPNLGSLSLRPEESKGWDIGLEHTFRDRIHLKGSYFASDIDNLIEFVSPTFVAVNISKADISGFELSGEYPINDRWSVEGSHTYLDARDASNNLFLQRRPKNASTAHVSYRPSDRWTIDAFYRHSGSTFSSTAERTPIPGYGIFSGVLAYNPRPDHRFWLRAENLFDKQYEETYLFGTPGQSFYAGYEHTFSGDGEDGGNSEPEVTAESESDFEPPMAKIPVEESYESAMNDARGAFESGGDMRAIEIYERAHALRPSSSRARYNIAVIHYRMNRYEQAAREFASVLEIDPSDGDARKFLALSREKAGRK